MHRIYPSSDILIIMCAKQGGRQERAALLDELSPLVPALVRSVKVRLTPELRRDLGDLTLHQLEALATLEKGSLTMRELCEHLDIAESAGTALVDKLVRHDLVERSGEPGDRRVVRIQMTSQARDMATRYRKLRRSQMQDTLKMLDNEKLTSLVAIAREIVAGSTGDSPSRATAASGSDSREMAGSRKDSRGTASYSVRTSGLVASR